MKKNIYVILAMMFLFGCTSVGETTEVVLDYVDSDFELKEKCNGYLEIAQNRVKEDNTTLTDYQNDRTLIGTYYSTIENTCISILFHPKDTLSNDHSIMHQIWGAYYYFDELTGEVLL
jgi:hypothetical protein